MDHHIPVLLSLLMVVYMVNSQSTGCEVNLKGFSSSETSKIGYIQVNGNPLVEFAHPSDSYYIALITDSCSDVSDDVDIPLNHQVNIDGFGKRISNVLEHTPRGYIILIATADDASKGLDDEAKRTLTYLGVDSANDGIEVGGVLLVAARKGFPSQTQFAIRPASDTTMKLTATFHFDLHAEQAFPPMQTFPAFTQSTTDAHVMLNRRFTGNGEVTGWYYNAATAGNANFGVWSFAEIVEGSGDIAPHDAAGIVSAGSNSVSMKQGANYFWVPENDRITVQEDNLIGCFFGSSSGALASANVDDYNKFEDPHKCGLADVTFYDLAYGVIKSGTFTTQPSSEFSGLSHSNMLIGLHPITSPNFVNSAPCSDDAFCQSKGDENMACASGSCGCRTGYAYNSPYDICILDSNAALEGLVAINLGGNGARVTDGDSTTCTANTPSSNPFTVIDLGSEYWVYSVKIKTGDNGVTPVGGSQANVNSAGENSVEQVEVVTKGWNGKPCVTTSNVVGVDDVTVSLVSSNDITLRYSDNAPFTTGSADYSLSGAQLRDFTIGVSSSYDGTTDLSPFQPCLHMPSALADSSEKELTCTNIHKGRYISISIKTSEIENEVIPLCEVEAYGIPDDMYDYKCNEDSDCQSPSDSTKPLRSVGMVCSKAKKCACGDGFTLEGKFCAKDDVDFCKDVPCQNNGECSNGADDFTCKCEFGYEGKLCSELIADHLYPYGKSTNDNVLHAKDDVSVRFSPDNLGGDGFIFGCNRYSSIYISDNGYLSFGEPFYMVSPSALGNSKDVPLIAPLAIDIELGPTEDGDSVVFYNSYQHQNQKLDRGSVDYYMFQRARQDMKKKYGDANFNPTQMVVVTWYKATPWPYSGSTLEKNTFQVVLLQDQVSLQSYFITLYGSLSWNGNVRDNAVAYQGIQPGGSFGAKNVYSGSPLAFSLDGIKGNRGEAGTWVYRGDADNCVDTDSPEYKCRAWYSQQNLYRGVLLDTILPYCPCQPWQAHFDPRFSRYTASSLCYVTTSRYSIGNILETGTRECCYTNNFWFGWLVSGVRWNAGSVFFNNPFYYTQNWALEDLIPKQWCCLESNLCNLYYERRPGDKFCTINLAMASFFGDPHILTLDGLEYDFNGKGEYWLIKSDSFTLQGRTAAALDKDGAPTKATVFSGFAAQDLTISGSPAVSINMNQERTDMEVYLRNAKIEWKDFNVTKPYILDGISLHNSNNSFRVSFPSEVGLTVSLAEEQLSITVVTTETMKNGTRGLLGVFNGDKTDDLTAPDETVLPADSTDEDIFNNFGEKWRITSPQSIFHYGDNEDFTTINDLSFKPLFKSDIDETIAGYTTEEKQKLESLCKGNAQCEFDYVLTGKEAVAENTLNTFETNKNDAALLGNTLPIVNATVQHGDEEVISNELWAIVGTPVTITVEGYDAEDTDVVLKVDNLPVGASFDAKTGVMTWTPTDLTPQKDLRFFATDSLGAVSNPIEIIIKICDCMDHGACDYKVLADGQWANETYQLTKCVCRPAWGGESCTIDTDWCTKYSPCSGQLCYDVEADFHDSNGTSHICAGCPDGTTLQDKQSCEDIDECVLGTDGCTQGCENTYGSFMCTCHDGYRMNDSGVCIDVKECDEGTHNCDHICVEEEGTFSCDCSNGYSLNGDQRTCLQDPHTADLCQNKVCEGGGFCFNDGGAPTCMCPSGYSLNGDTCTDIDECSTVNACVNSDCSNTDGSYECTCNPGFKPTGDGRTCSMCQSGTWGVNCANYCSCKDSDTDCDGEDGCAACANGWEGGSCEKNINECITNNGGCSDHSTCEDTEGSFTCTCIDGYELKGEGNCKAINLCETASEVFCEHGGQCVFNEKTLEKSCDCRTANGYTGKMCEIDEDECTKDEGHECQNGGTCVDGAGFYSCLCTNDTYGVLCEKTFDTQTNDGIDITPGVLGAILGSVAGILLLAFVVILVLFMCRQKRQRRDYDDDDTETSYSREEGSVTSTLPRSARQYWQPWSGAFMGNVWNSKNPNVNPYKDASRHAQPFQEGRQPRGPTAGYSGMMLPRLQRNAGRSPAGKQNYKQGEQFGWSPVS